MEESRKEGKNMPKPIKTKVTSCILIFLFSLIIALSIYVIVLAINVTVLMVEAGHVIDSYWCIDRAVMTFITFPVMILASVAGIVFSVFKLRLAMKPQGEAQQPRRKRSAKQKLNLAILICFIVIVVAFACRVAVDIF